MEHDFIVITSKGEITTKKALLARQSWASSLAQAMAAPIRRNLNYAELARRVLNVEPLPQGALPIYNTKPYQHDAIVITSRKYSGQKRAIGITGSRVTVPTFSLFSNPTVKISDVKRRRFDMIDRATQKEKYKHDAIIITHNGKIGLKSKLNRQSLMSQVAQKARQEIMAQEDASIFEALDAIGYKDE